MSQKIAVAVIHGIGRQDEDFAAPVIEKITEKFAELLPDHDKTVDDKLEIQPVYWAKILTEKQEELALKLNNLKDLHFGSLRDFILNFVGDAVAYQPGATRRDIYKAIHKEFWTCLSKLAAKAGSHAPLCVIAHSLGTVIMHNYFFDVGYANISKRMQEKSTLQTGRTLALVYTMGSPLALWSLRYDEYLPMPFPGSSLAELYPDIKPIWINYYDKDDVVALPLQPIHPDLHQQGLLEDVQTNVGRWWESWNPLSHMGYWSDDNTITPISQSLFELWQAANR